MYILGDLTGDFNCLRSSSLPLPNHVILGKKFFSILKSWFAYMHSPLQEHTLLAWDPSEARGLRSNAGTAGAPCWREKGTEAIIKHAWGCSSEEL